MKTLILSISLLASMISTSFANTSACGDDSTDREYPALTWEKAATYKVNTSFVNLNAIVCVGISYSTLEIKRLHYRDNTGIKRNYAISQLKRNDIVLLKRSDFPSAARLVTRNVDPLTIRFTSDKLIGNKRNYSLSFKFVRNMARGWSTTDIRELSVFGTVKKHAYSPLDIFYKEKNTKTSFDALYLNLGGSLKIETIDLSQNTRKVKRIDTSKLRKVRRN